MSITVFQHYGARASYAAVRFVCNWQVASLKGRLELQ
jgi:hypothetical protein